MKFSNIFDAIFKILLFCHTLFLALKNIFLQGDDSLILPTTVSMEKLKQFHQAVVNKRDKILTRVVNENVPAPSSSRPVTASSSNSDSNNKQQTNEIKCSGSVNSLGLSLHAQVNFLL